MEAEDLSRRIEKLKALTKREREIIEWVSAGRSYYQISAELNIEKTTVQFHMKNIYEKLDITDKHKEARRVELGKFCSLLGQISEPDATQTHGQILTSLSDDKLLLQSQGSDLHSVSEDNRPAQLQAADSYIRDLDEINIEEPLDPLISEVHTEFQKDASPNTQKKQKHHVSAKKTWLLFVTAFTTLLVLTLISFSPIRIHLFSVDTEKNITPVVAKPTTFSVERSATKPQHNIQILFDETHNEYAASRLSAPKLEALKRELDKIGYRTSRLQNGPITKQNLSNQDILAILEPFNPPRPFTSQEIEAIKNFVHNGGGLLLVSVGWSWVDYTKSSVQEDPANQLGREFGITVNDDSLADPTDHIGSDELHPLFHKFNKYHPIIENHDIDNIASAGNVSSLRISGSAVGLVWGDEDTYSAKYHQQTFEKGSRPIIAAVSEYGRGRVAYFGHLGFMTIEKSQTGLYDYNNRQFVLSTFEWLAGML